MKIKIIGSGISGLLTAYYLSKFAQEHHETLDIHIYEAQEEEISNASTNSLAWLNVVYPSKNMHCATEDKEKNDQTKASYDMFRMEAIKDWHRLIKQFKKDGITDVLSTEKEKIIINGYDVNSIFIFFDQAQEEDFLKMNARFHSNENNYQSVEITKSDFANYFDFLNELPETIRIRNIANEQLINPKHLRIQLIDFLTHAGVQFHWNARVAVESIQSEIDTHWIVAAGSECSSLIKNTKLDKVEFNESNFADVIHCQLKLPLDLKGKVIHFASTETTPSFHLRNDELETDRIKIIVARQSGKNASLPEIAQSIIKLLNLQVTECICDEAVKRPMTGDGRPLVEMKLGIHENIHVVFGHSLYTNGAKLFFHFAQQLIFCIKQKNPSCFSSLEEPSSDLDDFKVVPGRFKTNVDKSNVKNNHYHYFKHANVFGIFNKVASHQRDNNKPVVTESKRVGENPIELFKM